MMMTLTRLIKKPMKVQLNTDIFELRKNIFMMFFAELFYLFKIIYAKKYYENRTNFDLKFIADKITRFS